MVKDPIIIEGAVIAFRNFSGKAGAFNPEGRKNFCVFLDEELANRLAEDGWNVRWLEPKDNREERQAYLSVAVNFANVPPKMLLISSKGKTILDDKSVEILDWAEIKEIDLVIQPYNWVMHEGTKAEKHGVKAYVKSMYVTIKEDELAEKYRNVPDSAADSIGGCGNCEACDGSCKHHGN